MSYDVVRRFEAQVAEYAGAKYGVAVSSCSNAIFLSFLWCMQNDPKSIIVFEIPKHTYPSIPNGIINAGKLTNKIIKIKWLNNKWNGIYTIYPYFIIDSALRFRKNMFSEEILFRTDNCYYCLSFHVKKRINIGRGGMILCNDKKAAEWFSSAKLDGRTEGADFMQEQLRMCGWNLYMTPEQAARGLQLLAQFKKEGNQNDLVQVYPDLSKQRIYQCG